MNGLFLILYRSLFCLNAVMSIQMNGNDARKVTVTTVRYRSTRPLILWTVSDRAIVRAATAN